MLLASLNQFELYNDSAKDIQSITNIYDNLEYLMDEHRSSLMMTWDVVDNISFRCSKRGEINKGQKDNRNNSKLKWGFPRNYSIDEISSSKID